MSLHLTEGPLLADLTTLRLGGRALAEVAVGDRKDLDGLPAMLERLGGRAMVLGRGSNILAADGELPLVLVRPPAGGEPRLVDVKGDVVPGQTVRVRASAGMGLPRLLNWLRDRGLSGLEGLSGIPGSVGGAVAMNAGSYGHDIRRVLARVQLYCPGCGLFWAPREDLDMGYRHFAPRVRDDYFMVMAMEVDLVQGQARDVARAMEEALTHKRSTQPVHLATAGCVFKNPPDGPPAGKLLDEAGFKGLRLGDVGFADMHANFLVNHGEGTASQAFELLEQARVSVNERFGVDLQLEVKVLA